jgi:DNA polymerase-1
VAGLDGVQLHLIESLEEAMEFKRWLGERHEGDLMGLDIETTGLDPREPGAAVRLIQFGDTQRGWAMSWEMWKGVALEALRGWDKTWVLQNCFAGDTEYLTRDGIRTLADSVGETVEVWGGDDWVKAEIRSFGQQELQKIVLAPRGRRTDYREVVYATPRHRWELIDGLLTVDIRVGDIVPMSAPVSDIDINSDNTGLIHGLMYADGGLTAYGKPNLRGEYRHQMRLCGAKARYAFLFDNVTYPASCGGDPQVYLKHTTNFKELPDTDSPEYIRSFIFGWADLDGTRNSTDRARCLITTREKDVEWLIKNAALGGYVVTGVTSQPVRSEWARTTTTTCWNVTLWSLEKNDDPKTRKRFNAWRVESIEPVDGTHEVYCAVVPDVERFTLRNGVFTSNCAFEYKWFDVHARGECEWQLPRDRTLDTMLAAQIIDPTRPAGLKSLATKYVDRRSAVGETALHNGMHENGWTWATVPVNYPPYHEYSALDPVLTTNLWLKLKPMIALYSDVFDLEMATRFIISEMEGRGARVDVDYSQQQYDRLADYADSVLAWGKSRYRANLGSNVQLARVIESLGGTIMEHTPTGQPRVTKETLQFFIAEGNGASADLRALCDAVLKMRKARKWASTYFKGFIDKSYNGYVHTDMKTMGARTGRMSASTIPLQQLPARGSALVRRAFVPRDGNVIITCDADQIEARIFATLSDDAAFQQAFKDADATGGDFFTEIGKTLYSDSTFAKSDPRRNLIKSMIYGSLYGAGLDKLALTAGVSTDHMRTVSDSLHAKFPGMQRFMDETESLGQERLRREGKAYVELPSGRRLPADDDRIYALLNYAIQGRAAEVLKKGIIRLDAAGLTDHMILTVHDECIFDIPKEYARDAMIEAGELMTDLDYAVPLTASAEGPYEHDWGQKYEK